MTYHVKHDGLNRCCLQTLDEHMIAVTDTPRPGDVLPCRECRTVMIVGESLVWESILSKARAQNATGE